MQDRSALRLRPLGIMRPATAEHQYARTSPGGCRRHPCLDVTAIRETDGLDMKQKLVHSRAVRDSIPTLNALCATSIRTRRTLATAPKTTDTARRRAVNGWTR